MASMRRETCKAGPLPLARRNSPRPGSVSRPAAVYLPVDSPPRARPNGHSSRPGSKNLNSGSTSASAPPVMATVAAAASKGLSQMDGTQAIHGMTASDPHKHHGQRQPCTTESDRPNQNNRPGCPFCLHPSRPQLCHPPDSPSLNRASLHDRQAVLPVQHSGNERNLAAPAAPA